MAAEVAVIGAGVVGSAVALALSRRGVSVSLLEAEADPGLAASGTNSGIVHTGFDSVPGELETELILRSAQLRGPVFDALGVPLLRCGAVLRPLDEDQRGQVAAIGANAATNGVEATLHDDGTLEVPGEAVTDPVAYTLALAGAAVRLGVELRTGVRVESLDDLGSRVVANCAGLFGDQVARLAGDDSFEIYPRKGEFLVFEPPPGEKLEHILLPVPTKRTKGVLVFPTLDGKVVAGPTAVDLEDKNDWSVRPEAADEIVPKAIAMWPALEGARQIGAYAGLRPAGRGVNYVIEPSRARPGLVNVAAIRSTGLTASLGIAERVTQIVAELGIQLGEEQPLERAAPEAGGVAWWRRTKEYRAA